MNAADLHERLRMIALLMHGLDGHADACEDDGDASGAALLRETIAGVRAVLPETADPKVFSFQWAIRFTAADGHEFRYDMPGELEARAAFDEACTATESAARWALVRRIVGAWEVAP